MLNSYLSFLNMFKISLSNWRFFLARKFTCSFVCIFSRVCLCWKYSQSIVCACTHRYALSTYNSINVVFTFFGWWPIMACCRSCVWVLQRSVKQCHIKRHFCIDDKIQFRVAAMDSTTLNIFFLFLFIFSRCTEFIFSVRCTSDD